LDVALDCIDARRRGNTAVTYRYATTAAANNQR
jgi:hypothetical protein